MHLRYADDTTLMAESEEELKRLLKKSKRGERKCRSLHLDYYRHKEHY